MLTLTSIKAAKQDHSLRFRAELYRRCVLAITQIIESNSRMKEIRIARLMGYSEKKRVQHVWRRNPRLQRVIRDYRLLMSSKKAKAEEVRLRLKERAENKRTIAPKLYRKVIKAAEITDPLLERLRAVR